MRPALRLLLAAAFVIPINSDEDACAVILKEEASRRACAALATHGLLPRRALGTATHAPHPHEEHHEEHHEAHTYEAGVYFGASLLIGALCLFIISRFYQAVPYTMAVFVIGLVLALVDHATEERLLGVYSRSMGRWRRMNPELLLCGFLPLLLFGDAMQINLHTFYTKMYRWFFRCMFGSIAAATDPVAVVALLNALGASPGLTMTITGESLFNDGTAMVLFLLFDSLAQKHKKYISGAGNPPYEVIEFFARMVLGGCFIGLAFGGAALLCLRLCQRKFDEVSTTLQITTTIIVAYASFYFSEIACGCSGVLATVMAALCVARYGWVYVDEAHTVHAVWEFLEHVGNTVVFMLAGSLTGKIVCENWKDSGGKGDWLDVADFGWLLFTWFALVIIRCLTIAMLWPLLKWLEQRYSHAHQLEWKDGVVMAWGGLRGAVGLALALVVQEERAHSDEAKSAEQLLFLVSGIAMLTLLINGWSCKALLDYLGMTVEIEKSQLQRQATQRWNRVRAATRLGVVQEALAYDTGVYGGNVGEDDLDAADREARTENNEQVLQRMRGMFLRALKAEFWEMIEKGLVPAVPSPAQILPFFVWRRAAKCAHEIASF
ncbi:unnamed protein product [Pelagomonas calceolata]|uniref:Cation/H+ exchanger transmembrane domain-containing protein n=1 Tax=Pelagomonas calceolata TaxID=35677 RepID=A0A8J2SYL5_9STRA|nr:unnamed protein product [Pelagomonas calceolata]